MKLVTAELMRQIDDATIEGKDNLCQPVPSLELMENAGRAVAEAIYEDFFEDAKKKRVAIFCGKGNNGGDGLVIARYLAEMGALVTVYLLAERDELSDDARANYDRIAKSKAKLKVVDEIADMPERLIADLQIDAILGTGFKGAPRGLALDLISYINSQDLPTCTVDNPSGLNIDTGSALGEVVNCERSYSLALPKRGHYISPGRELAGIVRTAPIGIPDKVVESFDIKENLITPEMVAEFLPVRRPDAHKGEFGRLFLLVGSAGLTGAGALAAEGAMRSGCGVATLGCPDTLEHIYEIKLTEAMTLGLPSVGKKGALALRALGPALEKVRKSDSVVIGPGLGLHRDTQELVRRIVWKLPKPSVLDADALTALSKDTSALKSEHPVHVLTPHAGEFTRLTGKDIPADFEQKLELIREVALEFNCVLILKGSPTLIANTNGQVYLNPTGNAGMATGGSGDVLAGMIGSFLAQGVSPVHAAIVGVYLHGLAGDIAANEVGQRSLIAGDLIECLPHAFEAVEG
ncbi:MAG: NAD(P)H-hydrate dehydratase [candidate division Zixibacteria bacterium]|nr:NAD(P)H-hydrate dehydratase [candidate division Zixibacteria bacterium]